MREEQNRYEATADGVAGEETEPLRLTADEFPCTNIPLARKNKAT